MLPDDQLLELLVMISHFTFLKMISGAHVHASSCIGVQAAAYDVLLQVIAG